MMKTITFSSQVLPSVLLVIVFQSAITGRANGEDFRLRRISTKKISDSDLTSLTMKDKSTVLCTTANAILQYDLVKQTTETMLAKEKLYSIVRNPANGVVATGGWDGEIETWDLSKMKSMGAVKAHNGLISALVVSTDGDLIASAGGDDGVRVWSNSKCKVVAALEGQLPIKPGAVDNVSRSILCLAISSDGRRLVSGAMDVLV